MAYKYAMAYIATGNARYAEQSLNITRAWATTNKIFGLRNRNGPLEAGW